jgi:hypothetical protein
MTGVAATKVSLTAGLPGTDEQSLRSSAPAIARPETSKKAAIAELEFARDGEQITPQEPQQSACTDPLEDAFANTTASFHKSER